MERARKRPDGLIVALVAVLVAAGVAAASGAGVSSSYNLSGRWTTPGTTLTLAQTGRVITWTGGPNNRAWIQTFKGTITDDPHYGPTFSGTFRQDEPGREPPRYHGTMRAQIQSSCKFVFLSIVQAGQPTLSNIHFEKQPCDLTGPALPRLKLILYKKRYVVDSKQRGLCPSSFECVVRNGAVVSICNRDDFIHEPFSLTSGNRFGGPVSRLVLKTGQCHERAFVNKKAHAIPVILYDAIHSNERFIVTVLPTR